MTAIISFSCSELTDELNNETSITINDTLIEYLELFNETSLSVTSKWTKDFNFKW